MNMCSRERKAPLGFPQVSNVLKYLFMWVAKLQQDYTMKGLDHI